MRRSSRSFSPLPDDSAKVAVYIAEMPAPQTQQELLQILIGVAFVVLSGLIAWAGS